MDWKKEPRRTRADKRRGACASKCPRDVEATVSDRAEVAADTSQASASAPDLASEILENLELNRKAHGLANANSTAVTLIGAALKFILDARGPAAARRELADIGEVLEAAIKFAHIERGLSSDLET
jgi:hypothetical protein